MYQVPVPRDELEMGMVINDAVPASVRDVHAWNPAAVSLPAEFKLTKYTRLKG